MLLRRHNGEICAFDGIKGFDDMVLTFRFDVYFFACRCGKHWLWPVVYSVCRLVRY